MAEVDPLLPMILAGRPPSSVNAFRAKIIAGGDLWMPSLPVEQRKRALEALLIKHFEWAGAHAAAWHEHQQQQRLDAPPGTLINDERRAIVEEPNG